MRTSQLLHSQDADCVRNCLRDELDVGRALCIPKIHLLRGVLAAFEQV